MQQRMTIFKHLNNNLLVYLIHNVQNDAELFLVYSVCHKLIHFYENESFNELDAKKIYPTRSYQSLDERQLITQKILIICWYSYICEYCINLCI